MSVRAVFSVLLNPLSDTLKNYTCLLYTSSKQLKEKNIAEYLIYMWQIEDLIRANGCDMEKIKSPIIAPYPVSYTHLCWRDYHN